MKSLASLSILLLLGSVPISAEEAPSFSIRIQTGDITSVAIEHNGSGNSVISMGDDSPEVTSSAEDGEQNITIHVGNILRMALGRNALSCIQLPAGQQSGCTTDSVND